MGFDGDLVLGLGLSSSLNTTPTKTENNKRLKNMTQQPLLKMEAPTSFSVFEPSLTLGPPSDASKEETAAGRNEVGRVSEDEPPGAAERFARQASPHSVVSSFSNVSKRERDVVSEEVEVERVCSRTSDEDEDNTNGRKKLRLTKEQSALLEESFKQHSTLNPKQKQALARQLNLRPRQVEVWFQNRRARTKLKQTEVDLELLKKCCETLTDENRRLQKELQELKALKLSHPFYMNMPAATLTMCPSCERTGAAAAVASENSPRKSPFSMAPKPHFFNPFTNPSAAC